MISAKQAFEITKNQAGKKYDHAIGYIENLIRAEAKEGNSAINFSSDSVGKFIMDKIVKRLEELEYTVGRNGESYTISWYQGPSTRPEPLPPSSNGQ